MRLSIPMPSLIAASVRPSGGSQRLSIEEGPNRIPDLVPTAPLRSRFTADDVASTYRMHPSNRALGAKVECRSTRDVRPEVEHHGARELTRSDGDGTGLGDGAQGERRRLTLPAAVLNPQYRRWGSDQTAWPTVFYQWQDSGLFPHNPAEMFNLIVECSHFDE